MKQTLNANALFALYAYHYGTFANVQKSDLVLNMKYGATKVCKDKHEYIIEKDFWSLIVRGVELTYDEKENTLIYNGHTLPCLHDDSFCHPRILTSCTIDWFPVDVCLSFSIHSFIGEISKIGNRYWLETERFFTNLTTLTLLQTPTQIKIASLVLKYILNKKPFATNPHHYILLNTLTSSFHTKKDLI